MVTIFSFKLCNIMPLLSERQLRTWRQVGLQFYALTLHALHLLGSKQLPTQQQMCFLLWTCFIWPPFVLAILVGISSAWWHRNSTYSPFDSLFDNHEHLVHAHHIVLDPPPWAFRMVGLRSKTDRSQHISTNNLLNLFRNNQSVSTRINHHYLTATSY